MFCSILKMSKKLKCWREILSFIKVEENKSVQDENKSVVAG